MRVNPKIYFVIHQVINSSVWVCTWWSDRAGCRGGITMRPGGQSGRTPATPPPPSWAPSSLPELTAPDHDPIVTMTFPWEEPWPWPRTSNSWCPRRNGDLWRMALIWTSPTSQVRKDGIDLTKSPSLHLFRNQYPRPFRKLCFSLSGKPYLYCILASRVLCLNLISLANIWPFYFLFCLTFTLPSSVSHFLFFLSLVAYFSNGVLVGISWNPSSPQWWAYFPVAVPR
jgi:hypothetical protein